MSYTPQTWADGSGGGTPLSAARLNYMETGIDDADTRVTAIEGGSLDSRYASPSYATSRAVALAMVLGS